MNPSSKYRNSTESFKPPCSEQNENCSHKVVATVLRLQCAMCFVELLRNLAKEIVTEKHVIFGYI